MIPHRSSLTFYFHLDEAQASNGSMSPEQHQTPGRPVRQCTYPLIFSPRAVPVPPWLLSEEDVPIPYSAFASKLQSQVLSLKSGIIFKRDTESGSHNPGCKKSKLRGRFNLGFGCHGNKSKIMTIHLLPRVVVCTVVNHVTLTALHN